MIAKAMLIQVVLTMFPHMEKSFFLLYFILGDGNEDKAEVNMSSTTNNAFSPLAV